MSLVPKCTCGGSLSGVCMPDKVVGCHSGNVKFPPGPVLTSEEFEAILFEVYKSGLHTGLCDGLAKKRTFYPDKISSEYFTTLMYKLKLKTTTICQKEQ